MPTPNFMSLFLLYDFTASLEGLIDEVSQHCEVNLSQGHALRKARCPQGSGCVMHLVSPLTETGHRGDGHVGRGMEECEWLDRLRCVTFAALLTIEELDWLVGFLPLD